MKPHQATQVPITILSEGSLTDDEMPKDMPIDVTKCTNNTENII